MGGLLRGEIACVVAPSNKGKSLYLQNQAITSLKEGRTVLYLTMEMSEDRIGNRLDGMITELDVNHLDSQQGEFKKRMQQFKEAFPDSKLLIKEFPNRRVTVNGIRAYMNQLEVKKGIVPDVLIVDYLEIIQPTGTDPEYLAQKRICEDLRALGMERKCLVWTATQTNRDGVKTRLIDEKELGESYDKLKPMDLLISLNQDDVEYDNGQLRIFTVKVRNGIARVISSARINRSTLVMYEPDLQEIFEEGQSSTGEASERVQNIVDKMRNTKK